MSAISTVLAVLVRVPPETMTLPDSAMLPFSVLVPPAKFSVPALVSGLLLKLCVPPLDLQRRAGRGGEAAAVGAAAGQAQGAVLHADSARVVEAGGDVGVVVAAVLQVGTGVVEEAADDAAPGGAAALVVEGLAGGQVDGGCADRLVGACR